MKILCMLLQQQLKNAVDFMLASLDFMQSRCQFHQSYTVPIAYIFRPAQPMSSGNKEKLRRNIVKQNFSWHPIIRFSGFETVSGLSSYKNQEAWLARNKFFISSYYILHTHTYIYASNLGIGHTLHAESS